MTTAPVWHGTADEGFALLTALAHNCACQYDGDGVKTTVCVPHRALTTEQVWLDRLLFERHLVERLLLEEFNLTPRVRP